jgi:hypothetical protein
MPDPENRVPPDFSTRIAACFAACGTGAMLGAGLGIIHCVVSAFVIQPLWIVGLAIAWPFVLAAGVIEGGIAGLLSGLLSSVMVRTWSRRVMRLIVTPMLCALLVAPLGLLAMAVIWFRTELSPPLLDPSYAEATIASLAIWHCVVLPFIGLLVGLISGYMLAPSRQPAPAQV